MPGRVEGHGGSNTRMRGMESSRLLFVAGLLGLFLRHSALLVYPNKFEIIN